ncbi:hypothetical protein DPV78_011718, partial [Talaromyces pinophilus]
LRLASSGGQGPLISNEGLSLAIVVAEASIKKPAENLQPEAPFTTSKGMALAASNFVTEMYPPGSDPQPILTGKRAEAVAILKQIPEANEVRFEPIQTDKKRAPKLQIPPYIDIMEPYQIFSLFFTEDLFKVLADNTNMYAYAKLSKNMNPHHRNWRSTTPGELKAFLGIASLTHAQFRRQLSKSLLLFAPPMARYMQPTSTKKRKTEDLQPSKPQNNTSLPHLVVKSYLKVQKRCIWCLYKNPKRQTGQSPSFMTFICQACDVPLCRPETGRTCFRDFHMR